AGCKKYETSGRADCRDDGGRDHHRLDIPFDGAPGRRLAHELACARARPHRRRLCTLAAICERYTLCIRDMENRGARRHTCLRRIAPGEDSLLERVTAAAEERRFSQN